MSIMLIVDEKLALDIQLTNFIDNVSTIVKYIHLVFCKPIQRKIRKNVKERSQIITKTHKKMSCICI